MGRAAEPITLRKCKCDSATRWPSVMALTYSAPCATLLDRKGAFVRAVLTIIYCYILLQLWRGETTRRREGSIRGAR